jgi:hypothetical protein
LARWAAIAASDLASEDEDEDEGEDEDSAR